MAMTREQLAEELAIVAGRVERLQRAMDQLHADEEAAEQQASEAAAEAKATDVDVKEPAPPPSKTSTASTSAGSSTSTKDTTKDK